ncbi:conserved hypothetical protein [Histoplasma capsulatum G186AR]|uniref:Uncharacterized protein n=2 Tax=Ajellomyces capsulatus TaxID=5037 RepID=C0NSN1_AJECG|nr:uncharacterized protein HCBG_06161 [Histoplasma capsulatum G186AR]EEH05897.1 conserved hypothetical protein [Histoplasma capsulatum G186AR]KAG5299933.1 hypothetical protein I7I52_10409 [Histoplasma capsulatum]QSS67438.1 hypothetical protein I7I50_06520 [Histoplasma capsulatum G186AR]
MFGSQALFLYSDQPPAQPPASPSRLVNGGPLPNNSDCNFPSIVPSCGDREMAEPGHSTNFNAIDSNNTSSALSAMSNDILPRLHTSSSTLSHSSFADVIDTNATPSTPLSGLSNHDYPQIPFSRSPAKTPIASHTHAHSRSVDIGSLRSSGLLKYTVVNSPIDGQPGGNTVIDISQGQKRTASGEVKSTGSPIFIRSPESVMATRRSGTMSTDSNSSRISELSAQLRARLSYAAAKVEKDWPIRQLEETHAVPPRFGCSSASQSPLPLGFKSPFRSPKGASHSRGRHSISSTLQDNGLPKLRNPNFTHMTSSMSPTNASARRNKSSSPNRRASTYIPPPVAFANSDPPRLAPPADIVSGNGNATRRRPNPNDTLLQTASANQNYHPRNESFADGGYSVSSTQTTTSTVAILDTSPDSQPQLSRQSATPSSITASTTTTRPVPKQRTPSQNALMEKDAIETLLFMSSPENSGYHPSSQQTQQNEYRGMHLTLPSPSLPRPSSQQSSPIEGRLGLGIRHNTPNAIRPARKVSFADDTSNSSSDAHPRNGPSGLREHEAGDAIDRMLDELGDSDSESESDWLMRFMSQSGGESMRPSSRG